MRARRGARRRRRTVNRMVPLAVKTDFLAALQECGNASEACRRVGVNRSTAYSWRGDAAFEAVWEDALRIRRESIRDELIEKALAATGRVVDVPVLDDEGRPVLDDDFEPVTSKRLVDYDGNVLRALLGKFVRSEDGAPVTAVQVNNSHHVHEPPERPRLVLNDDDEDLEP